MREANETESSYMRRMFQAATEEDMLDEVEDQLVAEGMDKRNLRSYKSRRRKEIKETQKGQKTAVGRSGGQLSAEAIVDNLAWPTNVNGEVDPSFVAGMRYEAMNIIRGIRMAQELNKMGLEQAKPVIEMAKEMRQAEGQAAQTIAAQLAQVNAQSNQQVIQAIQGLAAQQGGREPPAEANPLAQAMTEAMQPYLMQAMQQMFSGVFKGMPGMAGMAQPGQHPAQEQPQQQQQGWQPPNVEDRSINEYEEEEDVQH